MRSKMLFTPHLFAFRKDGLREKLTATSLGGQKLCLVPRGQCSFRRIKITGNNKKSLKAAEFRVRQEADLGENKFIIKPDDSGHYAGVWGFKSDSRHKGRYIPESLALSQQTDGGQKSLILKNGLLFCIVCKPSMILILFLYHLLRR